GDIGQDVWCAFPQQSRFMVRSIQLPEASPTEPPPPWNSYEFGYEDGSGWGHLTSMRTPSGSQYNYQSAFDAIVQKTITHDGQNDLTWSYVGHLTGTTRTTTITAPDGGRTVYSFFDD